MRVTTFLIIFSLLISCKPSVPSFQDKMVSLEKSYSQNPTIENANELIEIYAEYTKNNPEELSENSRLLRKTAQIYFDNQEFLKSAGTLVLAIKQYYQSGETQENILQLADIYQNHLSNPEAATATLNGFIHAFPDHENSEQLKKELGESYVDLNPNLIALGTKIFETPDGKPGFNRDAAEKYIGHSEIYALTNGGNVDLASDMLMKAASVARTAKNYSKALEYYYWLSEAYPEHEAGKKAFFLQAFTLDNDMGKAEEARPIYQAFVNKYPDHHFVDDANFQLKNLGKSNSQIIDSFEKQSNPPSQ